MHELRANSPGGENTHALRLKSELFDLRAAYATAEGASLEIVICYWKACPRKPLIYKGF